MDILRFKIKLGRDELFSSVYWRDSIFDFVVISNAL